MTTSGIDFAKLDLQDALDLAALVEEEAQERYEEFTHQLTLHRALDAAGFFLFMAKNEAKHGQELRARRRLLFGETPRRVTRAQLFDVEAPGYDEVRAFMSPREALAAALRAEAQAHDFFARALPRIHDAGVRRLFAELRDEELRHEELVRQQLARLPGGATLDEQAFVDEPVGQ